LSFVFAIRSRSFRVDPARLIPRTGRGKPALLLCLLILAGCGGSAHEQTRVVEGPGFRFAAPVGWRVGSAPRSARASRDSQLLQVTTFPLLRPYSDGLFEKVRRELDARMQGVAQQLHGTVAGSRTVTAGGIRSHSYRLNARGDVVEYTFVLRGRREYELVCRRPAKASDAPCAGLITSFRVV
jgi:hypothetical protein